MRSLIILSNEQLKEAFTSELKVYDQRIHYMSNSFLGAHDGRITADEMYQLTFEGKFNFKK